MCEGLKPIGGVYCGVSRAFLRGIHEGGVRCLKANKHDSGVALEVPVKEATSKGYAVARGGRTQSIYQCLEAKQEEGESG